MSYTVQGWTKKLSPGLVNCAPAVADHLCLHLLENISQPRDHFLAQTPLSYFSKNCSSLFVRDSLPPMRTSYKGGPQQLRRQNNTSRHTCTPSHPLSSLSERARPLVSYIKLPFLYELLPPPNKTHAKHLDLLGQGM